MQWIKRNVFFVAGCGAALVLLILAAYLVFSNISEDAAIQEELNQQVSEWQRLNSSPSFPNDENIAVAKADQKKFRDLQQDAAKLFVPAAKLPKMDDQAFARHLASTIADLRARADRAGVALPQQFDFTFSAHRQSLKFPAASIEPWLGQLEEIKVICGVLFTARINALDGIQRVAVSPQDAGNAEFLANGAIVSNQFGIFTPYQVSFRTFSSEVGAVLEGFTRATNCVVVKNVVVTPSSVPLGSAADPAAAAPVMNVRPRRFAAPVSGGGKDAPGPAAPVSASYTSPFAGRPAASGAGATIIAEQPLQVTLVLDFVKLTVGK